MFNMMFDESRTVYMPCLDNERCTGLPDKEPICVEELNAVDPLESPPQPASESPLKTAGQLSDEVAVVGAARSTGARSAGMELLRRTRSNRTGVCGSQLEQWPTVLPRGA